jgi:hypothetical protein
MLKELCKFRTMFDTTQWVHLLLIEKHENNIRSLVKEIPACYRLSAVLFE